MHTDQSRLVRQSMEATAHPDVYARRKVATRRATEVVIDLNAPVTPEAAEALVGAIGEAISIDSWGIARVPGVEGDHDDPDHCTCPTSAPDAFGNCDLIERDDCPVHGSGYLPGEAPEIGPAADDAERVVGEVFQSFGTRVLGLSPDASLDEIKSALDAAPMPHRPIAHDGQGGIRYMTIDEMREAGHPLPDSADTRLHGDRFDRAFTEMEEERAMAGLGRRREGWRGRLAHVEMLLSAGRLRVGNVIPAEIDQALAELRALIDEA